MSSGQLNRDRPSRFPRSAVSRTGAAFLTGVLILLLDAQPGLTAQEAPPEPRVAGAALEAVATRIDGTAEVEIHYQLRVAGRDSIPLRALEFFDVRIEDVEARAEGGDPLEVTVGPSASGSVTGSVVLPAGVSDLPSLEIVLTYALRGPTPAGGADFDTILPVLMVDWAPEGSRDELFTARVRLPDDYAVVEAFPMVPRRVEPGDAGRTHALSLPAVPSMLRFRGRVGERPLLTLGRWVDLGVGVVIVLLGTLGWRALQRAEAEHRRVGTRRSGGGR